MIKSSIALEEFERTMVDVSELFLPLLENRLDLQFVRLLNQSDAICNVCLIFTSSANVCSKYFRCLASKRALGFNSFHVSSLT